MKMLRETFLQLVLEYSSNEKEAVSFWNEIEAAHSGKKRFYHSLSHLAHLLNQLTPLRQELDNWNAVLFTLFYHDVVYNALKSDNEEQSAKLAVERMTTLGCDPELVRLVEAQILATKKHEPSSNSDTNYFTDADLSVLGADWETYEAYFKGVRKEYSIYPDLIYKPGRKKVLKHFLAMEHIFKTNHFRSNLEANARMNLKRELEML